MYVRTLRLLLMFVGIIIFTIGSIYIGYRIFEPAPKEIATAEEEAVLAAFDGETEEALPDDDDEPVNMFEADRIAGDTRIIYEYLTAGEEPEYREVSMPYYFLGMSEENVSNILTEGWSIKEFSDEFVILSREVEKTEQDVYTLGVHNGYIAVYYSDRNVMETTNTPVSTLSIDEQDRLTAGIEITGEEQLVKVLEDYGS